MIIMRVMKPHPFGDNNVLQRTVAYSFVAAVMLQQIHGLIPSLRRCRVLRP